MKFEINLICRSKYNYTFLKNGFYLCNVNIFYTWKKKQWLNLNKRFIVYVCTEKYPKMYWLCLFLYFQNCACSFYQSLGVSFPKLRASRSNVATLFIKRTFILNINSLNFKLYLSISFETLPFFHLTHAL